MASSRRFTFRSIDLPADTFSVVSFTGHEALSQPYAFTIELVSTNSDLEMQDVVEGVSELGIIHPNGSYVYKGILARLEQLRSVDKYIFYRAVLVPRLWALQLTRHNRIFLDKSVPEILREVLTDSGVLHADDFELRLMQQYPAREYVCQYRESNFAFISRWMEREGMYYFFEQTERGDKLIITDTSSAHTPLPQAPKLYYNQGKGLESPKKEELATSFVYEQNLAPRDVLVKDYNYRKPDVDLQSQSPVSDTGMGRVYVYGDNVKTQQEAKRQAELRAEAAKSKSTLFKGESTAPFLRAGYLFELENHFRSSCNRKYLTQEVYHDGDQSSYLLAGLGRALSAPKAKNYYRNRFTAIESDAQFRPERSTETPRIYGVIHAVVDAEGEGQYAMLDEIGRYKVRLPFDLSGRPDGKASCWVRMATPYGGAGHGMHFPLLKGAEVLLTFMDGDPDRPVIASAVPNDVQRSVVHDENAPVNAIQTPEGNRIVLGDQQGGGVIGLHTPEKTSSIIMGGGVGVGSGGLGGGGQENKNASKSATQWITDNIGEGAGLSFSTHGNFESFNLGSHTTFTAGATNSVSGGSKFSAFLGQSGDLTVGASQSCTLGSKFDFGYTDSVTYNKGKSSSLSNTADIFGVKEVRIGGGVDHSMTKAYWLAIAALATHIVTQTGQMAFDAGSTITPRIPDYMMAPWKKYVVSGASEVVGGAVGVLGIVGDLLLIHKALKHIKKAEEEMETGQVLIDRNGVRIDVKGELLHQPTLFLESHYSDLGFGGSIEANQNPSANKSYVKIDKKADAIELNNKAGASVKLKGGKTIVLEVGVEPGSGIQLQTSGSKILVKDDEISLQIGPAGTPLSQLKMDAKGVKYSGGMTKIESKMTDIGDLRIVELE